MRRWFGVGIVLLILASLSPDGAAAQGTTKRDPGARVRRGNYPNPFNPVTKIPFELFEEDFPNGKPAVVSIRIYNVLMQPVAVPTAMDHPQGNGALVENLKYTDAGLKEAFWDGTDRTRKKVASGVYLYIVTVNGQKSPPKKMIITK
jgi:hypothetical protein